MVLLLGIFSIRQYVYLSSLQDDCNGLRHTGQAPLFIASFYLHFCFYSLSYTRPGQQTFTMSKNGDSGTKEDKIQQFVNTLEENYDKIEHFPSAFLGPETYKDLSIRCEELKLQDNGLYEVIPSPCFFDPRVPDVHQYPCSFENGDRNYRHQQNLYKLIQEYATDPIQARQSACMLCYEMDWAFETYPREKIDHNQGSLS